MIKKIRDTGYTSYKIEQYKINKYIKYLFKISDFFDTYNYWIINYNNF